MIRLASAALAGLMLLAAISPADARRYYRHHFHNWRPFYRSVDGTMVHRPQGIYHRRFGHEEAVCRDGTHSYSHHRRGTCSHHGGVARWR